MAEDQPKKYIRTLAGDMETLQKGGIPELAPLVTSTPRERLIAASPLDSRPPKAPEPLPPPPVQPRPAPGIPELAPLKTYAGDFSDLMQQGHAALSTVLAAEQDAGPRAPEASSQQFSRSNLMYLIAGVVLLVTGISGATIAYLRYQAAITPVVVAPSETTPIFVDEREMVSGTGTTLVQAVKQSVDRPIKQGAVRLLTFTPTAGADTVFSALRTTAPGTLLRNVNAQGSMTGIVNAGGSQSPFFIFSVTSYSQTFAGMLQWERLIMHDLGGLFPPYPAPIMNAPTATSTVAATTTTKVATSSLQVAAGSVATFHDEVVSNHDVRIYRDAAGKSILLYGYWNQFTLVIARDPAAFTEILGRLATSRSQ